MPTKLPNFNPPQPTYPPGLYPLYEMVINTDTTLWLSLRDAASWFDQGYIACKMGAQAIDSFGALPRRMTEDDKAKIRELADQMSASK